MTQTVNKMSNVDKQAKAEAMKKKAEAMTTKVWKSLTERGVTKDLYLHPEWREVCQKSDKIEREAERLVRDFTPVVGEGATLHYYTDAHAYTIISVSKSGKSFKMQQDEATRITDPEIIPGGFAGHCVNNHSIDYTYKPNSDGRVIEVRMTKNGWKYKASQRVSSGRHEHYDYNF